MRDATEGYIADQSSFRGKQGMKVKKDLAQTVDVSVVRQVVIENPIINSPFAKPTHVNDIRRRVALWRRGATVTCPTGITAVN